MALHSLKLLNEKIVFFEWTCNECTNNDICHDCNLKKSGTKDDVIRSENIEFVSADEQHEYEFDQASNFVNEDSDNGQTDVSDESDNETEAEYNSGELIWAKHGRVWYPAQTCYLPEVPVHPQKRFQCKK